MCPILLQASHSSLLPRYTVPTLPYIQYLFKYFLDTQEPLQYLHYLLFPDSRLRSCFPRLPDPSKAFLNVINNFITGIDTILHPLETTHIDPVTCLSLPLLTILQFTPPTNPIFLPSYLPPNRLFEGHPGVKKLLVVDVFIYDFDSQTLRVRDRASAEFHRYPSVAHRVAQWINNGQLFIQPFINALRQPAPRYNITPFIFSTMKPQLANICHRLVFPHSVDSLQTSKIPLNSIKYYKQLIPINTPPNISPLSDKQWRQFWSFKIPLQARTIWYRYIHKKIPTKEILHHLIPNTHPSPHCTICTHPTPETLQHFLFECPSKLSVWRFILHKYLNTIFSYDSDLILLLNKFLTIEIDVVPGLPSQPCSTLSNYQIFSCTLNTIWQNHWRNIFDFTPFITSNVITSTTRALTRLDAEFQSTCR